MLFFKIIHYGHKVTDKNYEEKLKKNISIEYSSKDTNRNG